VDERTARMKLPDALFQDVTGLSVAAAAAVDEDRRAAQRVFLGQRTTVLRDRLGVSDDVSEGIIGRLSVTGIGVVCDRAVEAGEVFTVMLPRQRGEAVPVRCAAVSCHRCGAGNTFLVGAVFEAVLSEEYPRDGAETTTSGR
jgi:hypothetical protein